MMSNKVGETLPPPLKWAGGKRWLVPYLKKIWEAWLVSSPSHAHPSRRLVEPFCGGLAITLGLAPTQALINDINPHLINFYKQVQLGLQISIPMRNDSTLYYEHRARFNDLIRLSCPPRF